MKTELSALWIAGIAILLLIYIAAMILRAAAVILTKRHKAECLMLPPGNRQREWIESVRLGTLQSVPAELKGKSL